MKELVEILIALAALMFFAWMMFGSKNEMTGDGVLDPTDPRTIGTLTGLTGGGVVDAVIVKIVLEQFEKQHGRKATTRDLGIVAGMMRGMR